MPAVPTCSVPFVNDWTAKPIVGRPLKVVAVVVVVVPVAVLNTVEPPPMSWWRPAGTVEPLKLKDIQPFWNVVGMFVRFFEPRTFVLLNVTTFASQQIESVCVGGGGETCVCETIVRSSRSYCVIT